MLRMNAMKKTVTLCDRCESPCPYDTIYAKTGQGVGAALQSYTDTEAVDLCPLCLRAVMADMVKAMDFAQAAAWVAKYRRPLKPVGR